MARAASVLILLSATTASLAQPGRGQNPRRFTGPCASSDPVYSRIANATGGQQFRMRPGEVEKAGAVMESGMLHSANVHFANGVLQRGAPRDVQIPVDSTMESVSFSVTVQCKDAVQIWRPSGELVTPAGAPGFRDTEMAAGRILMVNRPEAGVWRVRVSGAGEFSVAVRAKSEIDFLSFDFVRVGGRPGHEGLFPIEGQPTSPDQIARARLSGPFRSATFQLLTEGGEPIGALSLSADGEEFTGNMRLPAEPFRIGVEGVDERGLPFRRIMPRLFQLQAIQITPLTRVEEIQAGATTRLSFQVQNLGSAGTFQVTVVWVGRNFVKNAPPVRVRLNTGEAAAIEADVDIPDDAIRHTEAMVTVSATRTTPPKSENGIALSMTVR